MNESLLLLLSTVYCLATEQRLLPSSFNNTSNQSMNSTSNSPSWYTFVPPFNKLSNSYSVDPIPLSCNDLFPVEQQTLFSPGTVSLSHSGDCFSIPTKANYDSIKKQHDDSEIPKLVSEETCYTNKIQNTTESCSIFNCSSSTTTCESSGSLSESSSVVDFETLLAISRSECLYSNEEKPIEQVW